MKKSNYNFFIDYKEDENKIIAYNALSNNLALMDKEEFDIFNNSENLDSIDNQLLSQLKIGNFIVDDELDELELIRFKMLESRFNRNLLSLTIAPTSACNFRCIYCYEKNSLQEVYMDESIIESILNYLKSHKNIDILSVTWYGGEPLLAIDTIKYLSENFIKICEENNINYSAYMVSNGYLLNEKNFNIIKNSKINGIQITLDGNENIHNKRRFLKNGGGTFKKIFQNLVDIQKYNSKNEVNISLRINLDKTNLNDYKEIIKLLKENNLDGLINPYIARVQSHNDCYKDSDCFTEEEFIKIKKEFEQIMEQNKNYKKFDYPKRINNFCGCDFYNSFVIDADGSLYNCWNDLGNKEMSFGNIKDKIEITPKYLNYIMNDPTQDKSCCECKILPICMGGCPFTRKSNKYNCNEYKYNLNQKLINSVIYLKNN